MTINPVINVWECICFTRGSHALFGVGVSYGARESALYCKSPPPTYPFWPYISFAMLWGVFSEVAHGVDYFYLFFFPFRSLSVCTCKLHVKLGSKFSFYAASFNHCENKRRQYRTNLRR
jgi:hypothetical protein